MNSLELLLMIVFVITVYQVVVNKLPSELVVGGAALLFTVLWIGFDNMNMWGTIPALENYGILKPKSEKRKQIKKRVRFDKTAKLEDGKTHKPNNDVNIEMDNEKIKEEIDKTMKKIKDGPSEKDPKIEPVVPTPPKQLTYSEDNYKYNIFDDLSCEGDAKIAHQMKHMSNKNRQAMDNFSRTYSKYSNINYFEQELKDAEASRWWDNQDLENSF